MSAPAAGSRYQPFFCEENAWWLARAPELAEHERWLLFLSNPSRAFAMFAQRCAPEGQPVVWDYHVVVLSRSPDGAGVWAWDPDHAGPLPRPAADWLAASFPVPLPDELRPRARLVEHEAVLSHFASDRRHMRAEEGWRAEPPPWPCIVSRAGAIHTLDAFVDTVAEGPGELLDLEGLRRFAEHRPGR